MIVDLTEQEVNFLKMQIDQTVPILLGQLETERVLKQRVMIRGMMAMFGSIREKLESPQQKEEKKDEVV